MTETPKQIIPILLFNDECGVCRRIGHWVQKSLRGVPAASGLIVQAIGDDPEALLLLNPNLDIWDAYATIHLLMPDGSMKLGGEAVAEVLRILPNTHWFTSIFSIGIFGVRPFQTGLNIGYTILADVRPLFGCESCGTPSFWFKPIHRMIKWIKALLGEHRHPSPHFTSLSPASLRKLPAVGTAGQ